MEVRQQWSRRGKWLHKAVRGEPVVATQRFQEQGQEPWQDQRMLARRLKLGAVVLLALGYMGETEIMNAWIGFTSA